MAVLLAELVAEGEPNDDARDILAPWFKALTLAYSTLRERQESGVDLCARCGTPETLRVIEGDFVCSMCVEQGEPQYICRYPATGTRAQNAWLLYLDRRGLLRGL
ncbi:MAG: hypothetical protein WAW17_02760 [Rhodococcus sp. (in: high G+C Gram-positive bacteria)]|uniref:hypothetical protein n=1 Tax=Rhodococcus sp. TaxID=1831 RepID=UPI003BB0D5CB